MKRLFLVLVTISAPAIAATFEERIERGYAAFETEHGEVYEKNLVPYIQGAIRKCAPAGSAAQGKLGKFVLVADVSSEGRVSNAVIKPETSASLCFSREFSVQALPVPPASMMTGNSAPLVVEVFIVP